MAKIPRYIAGQTNVGMLEQGRRAIIGPQEAAAAAEAPYKAAAGVAGAGANILFTIDRNNKLLDKAEDKVKNAVEDGYYETALKNAKTDHENRSLNDPEWTQQHYIDEINAIHEARRGGLDRLKDSGIRSKSSQMFEANRNMINQNVRLDAASLQATKIGVDWKVGYNQFIKDENYEMARDMIQVGLDAADGETPILGKLEGQELQHDLEELIKDQEMTDKAKDIQQIFMNDPVEGMNEYRKVLESGDMVLAGKVAGAINQAIKSQNFEKQELSDQYDNIRNEDILDIQMNADSRMSSPADIVNKYEHDGYGDMEDPASFARMQSVMRELEARLKADKDHIDFGVELNSGYPMQDNQTNRERLGKYIRNLSTKGKTEEEIVQAEWNAINQAGFPTQQHRNSLKAGPRSAPDMNRYLDLFKAYTSGDKKFDLGLNPAEHSDYLYIETRTEYIDTPKEKAIAIEEWIQARKNRLTATNDVWKEDVYGNKTGQEIMDKAFKKAWKSGQFKEGWISAGDSYRNDLVERELYKKFMFIARHQLVELSATPDMAVHNATKFMESMGRTTNINGRKETQMHIPAWAEDIEMGHMKDTASDSILSGVTSFEGEQVKVLHYQTVKGPVDVDDMDEGLIDLYVPMVKANSRNEDGDVVFEVWYDGNPLSAETDKGQIIMTVSFTEAEFVDQETVFQERVEVAGKIVDLQDDINNLVKEEAARAGHDRTSGLFIYGTPNIDVEIQDAKDALVKARSILDKPDLPK